VHGQIVVVAVDDFVPVTGDGELVGASPTDEDPNNFVVPLIEMAIAKYVLFFTTTFSYNYILPGFSEEAIEDSKQEAIQAKPVFFFCTEESQLTTMLTRRETSKTFYAFCSSRKSVKM